MAMADHLWGGRSQARYYSSNVFAWPTTNVCPRTGGSQFWQTIIQLSTALYLGSSIVVDSGTSTLFWLDRWSGTHPFTIRFQPVFNIFSETSPWLRPLQTSGGSPFDKPLVPRSATFGRSLLHVWRYTHPISTTICLVGILSPAANFPQNHYITL